MGRWIYGLNRWIDAFLDGWIDRRLDRWMAERMDGRLEMAQNMQKNKQLRKSHGRCYKIELRGKLHCLLLTHSTGN